MDKSLLSFYTDGYAGNALPNDTSDYNRLAHCLGIYHRETRKAPLVTSYIIKDRLTYLQKQDEDRIQRQNNSCT